MEFPALRFKKADSAYLKWFTTQCRANAEQVFCDSRVQKALKNPYLTKTDNSDSNLAFTPVDNKKFFQQKSHELYSKTKVLYNLDFDSVQKLHLRGLERFRKINNEQFVLYVNCNPLGRAIAGWSIASESSDSIRAKLASKQRAREKALANSDLWAYFVTLTFDGAKQDRHNFDKLRNRVTKSLQRRNIKYFFVPELHKNGGIHFHMLVSKELEPYLSEFRDSAPKALKNPYIRNSLAEGKHLLNCEFLADTYGYNICEPIRNSEACCNYMTKYVLKTFDSESYARLSRKRFFCSTGLKEPEVVLPTFVDLNNFTPVAFSESTIKVYLKRKKSQAYTTGSVPCACNNAPPPSPINSPLQL